MKTDLRNTKIDLSNYSENDRAKFQRFAFENGGYWIYHKQNIVNLEFPYYYIDNDLMITCSSNRFDSSYIGYNRIYFTDLFKEDSKEETPYFDREDSKDLRIKELEEALNNSYDIIDLIVKTRDVEAIGYESVLMTRGKIFLNRVKQVLNF